MALKTVKIFLIDDGDATGRIRCSLENWDGVVYKIPCTKRAQCSKDTRAFIGECGEHLTHCGIYFLIGKDPDSGQETVYVGQSNESGGVWPRVSGNNHDKNKKKADSEGQPSGSERALIDEWLEAVIIVNKKKESSLSAGLNYLENKFFQIVKEGDGAGRYKMLNKRKPPSYSIGEEEKSIFDNFAENAKTLMIVLGYNNVFEQLPPTKPDESGKEDKDMLFLEHDNAKARGKQIAGGFVVMAGSTIRPDIVRSCRQGIRDLREKYADKIDNNHVLTSHIEFDSPSQAASFVAGAGLNGRDEWHDRDNRSLKEIQDGYVEKEIPQVPKKDKNTSDEPALDSSTLDNTEAELLTGRRIVKFRYLEHEQPVSSWADMFEQVLKMLHQANKSVLASLAERDYVRGIHVSFSEGELRRAMKIDDRVYVEGNTNTKDKISQLRQLFDLYKINKTDLTFFYRSKS